MLTYIKKVWAYTKKVDTISNYLLQLNRHQKEVSNMSTSNRGCRYDEEFKRTIVNLYNNGGKTQVALCQEYGISLTTLSRWIKLYSTVETDDGEVLTAKQVKELQKRNAQLEEEIMILKKAIAIFTPHSNND